MWLIIHGGWVCLKEVKNKDMGSAERMCCAEMPGFNLKTEKNVPHKGTTSMFPRK